MSVFHADNSFQLKHQLTGNNNAGAAHPHMNVFVINEYRRLAHEFNSMFFKLNGQTPLVNDFLKAPARRITKLHGCTGKLAGQIIVCFALHGRLRFRLNIKQAKFSFGLSCFFMLYLSQ